MGLRSLLLLLVVAWALPASARPAQDSQLVERQEPNLREQGLDQDVPIVRAIEVVGLTSFPESLILDAMGLKVGEPLPDMGRNQAVLNVYRSYKVLVQAPQVLEVPGGVRVRVPVVEFPVDLEPRFIGNDSYSEKKIREWAGLTGRAELFLDEADYVVARLEEAYRTKGFHHVQVTTEVAELQEGSTAGDLIFVIREGPKVRVSEVTVNGNEHLENRGFLFWKTGLFELAKPKTKGLGIFRWWGGTFVEDELKADIISMRQVYRDLGYLDAQVQIDRLEFNDKRNRVKVHLIVDEGPLYHVASLSVEAFEVEWENGRITRTVPAELIFPEEDLLADLELQPGRSYERARLEHDRGVLRRYYGSRGYLEDRLFEDPERSGGWRWLEPDRVFDAEKAEIHITYRMVQGRQRFIRRMEINGNLHTRDKVVRREISALPGERADLSELERSLQRLTGSGYYIDRQDPRHPPPMFVLRSVTGDPDAVDVEYVVEEGRVVDFQISGGVASDSGLVGLLSLNMTNFDSGAFPRGAGSMFGDIYRKEAFHGNGETLSIDLSPGSEVSFWRLAYQHPDVFGSHFNRWGAGGEVLGRTRLFSSHDEQRQRVRLNMSHFFGQGDVALRFGPIYQDVTLENPSNEPLPSTLVNSLGSTYFQGLEGRLTYSGLDNRISPRSGTYAALDGFVYGGPFGGQQDFVKFELNLEHYMRLSLSDDDIDPVVYFNLTSGLAAPYGDTDFVNYAERFFLGGSVLMRGFDFRGVGPNEGNYALGGETMLAGTFEFRWPLFSQAIPGTSRRQEVFRAGPFLDWGVMDPDAFALDPSELRVSAGVSFSLVTPIPVTFNLGWPIEKGEGDRTEVFSFRLSVR